MRPTDLPTAVAAALPEHLGGSASLDAVVDVVNDRRSQPLDAERVLAGPDIRRPHPARTVDGHAISANEHARLLRARDDWVAVQLAREVDTAAVPALVERRVRDPWAAVSAFVAERDAAPAVERARLLEIPAAVLGEVTTADPVAAVEVLDAPRRRRGGAVADLSSMWAGPLAAKLLGDELGLSVVDVENPSRTDPMRASGDSFARFLHGGRTLVEFEVSGDTSRLDDVLAEAAVVVTSGRRRSLRSLGLDPSGWARSRGGVWIHVSGFGLRSPLADAPAFGDDAAIAGGLCDADDDGPLFLGDAAADPVTGMFAALIGARLVDAGLAAVVDVSMAASAAYLAGNTGDSVAAPVVGVTG